MQRFENKYDLLNAAYKDETLKKGAIALLQYLVHKSNKEQCFPAVETIAKALGCCKRTVQYNMRKLERAGYIIRKDRFYNHQQLSNQYLFHFGIAEDKPGEMLFSDEEYELLNHVSFNIPEKQICKITEIMKIYKMNLTTREKQMLVYLCHRANKKGMIYDIYSAFTKAVGMGKRSLMCVLDALKRKGLLIIKSVLLRGKEYLVLQLTGKVYNKKKNQEEVAKCEVQQKEVSEYMPQQKKISDYKVQQDEQKQVTDQNQELKKSIQYVQNCTRKIRVNDTIKELKRGVRKWMLKQISIHFRIFMSAFKTKVESKWEKIRRILHI